MFEYYDNDFAHGRLVDTIIRIDDKAAVITNVGGDQDLSYFDLESLKGGEINIRDERVNIVPPSLGYVSLGGSWKYFFRDPVRRWKQGIPLDTFGRGLTERNLTRIGRSLNGRFTSFNVAKRAKMTVAFHKHFAVNDGALQYKGETVGSVSVEGMIRLLDKHLFLKEYLEESVR